MRGGREHFRALSAEGVRLEQRVELARGHWRHEEHAGAIRSAGWWESVTVTWAPAATPARPPSLLHRALVTALDAITPSLAELGTGLATAGARRLLARRPGARVFPPPSHRELPAARRALPRKQKGV